MTHATTNAMASMNSLVPNYDQKVALQQLPPITDQSDVAEFARTATRAHKGTIFIIGQLATSLSTERLTQNALLFHADATSQEPIGDLFRSALIMQVLLRRESNLAALRAGIQQIEQGNARFQEKNNRLQTEVTQAQRDLQQQRDNLQQIDQNDLTNRQRLAASNTLNQETTEIARDTNNIAKKTETYRKTAVSI